MMLLCPGRHQFSKTTGRMAHSFFPDMRRAAVDLEADMASHPWMKFYPAEWLAEASIRRVSFAARGLWIELVCALHSMPMRGEFRDRAGKPLDDAAILRMVGAPDQSPLLAELESAEVFSRASDGAITCRRMVREREVSGVRSDAANARWKRPASGFAYANPMQSTMQTPMHALVSGISGSSSGSQEGVQGEGVAPVPPCHDADTIPTAVLWGVIRLYPKQSAKLAAVASLRRAIARVADARHGGGTTEALEWLKGRVSLYAKMRGRSDKRFIPNMDRWLDAGRYDDDEKVWKDEAKRGGEHDGY